MRIFLIKGDFLCFDSKVNSVQCVGFLFRTPKFVASSMETLFFLREINGNALGYLFGDKMAKPGLIGPTCEYTNIFDIYLPKHFIVIIGIRLCCSFVFIFVRLLKVEPVACIVRPHCRHGQLANVLLKGKV
jgi:hypothetical protein